MDIAVFGGSFNPPHVGHAMVASWLLWTGRAQEVWLVPTFQHAFAKDLAPFPTRVSWCRALAQDLGLPVRVDPIEANLSVPSFTLDTLEALALAHPEHRLRLVVGTDILAQVAHWKRWDLIEARFHPILVARGGYEDGAFQGSPVFPEVSSSEIRERCSRGLPVDSLVTRSVARLLEEGRG